MTESPLVVGLGEAMLRLSPPVGRRIQNADTLELHVAGAEANVLAALARLGVRSHLITALPDTPLGRRAADELVMAGVELTTVQWRLDARMGLFFLEQGPPPRSITVWYDRRGSAFAESIEWPPGALAGADAAVLSGITPAISQAAAAAATAMAEEATALGVRLCVDVNYRGRLWSPDEARDALAPLLARADVVVCAERDAEAVFGSEAADPARLRDRWAPRASVCVITRAERGCSAVADQAGRVDVPAVPTTFVDRLGVGDAFLAGLLRGILRGEELLASLHAGVALAALKATVSGDLSLASADDLDALLNKPGRARVQR